MPRLEPIVFAAPPRGICFRAHAGEQEERRRLTEEAFARGAAEGERRLSEQLLRQRTEMLALQNGILESLRQAVPEVARQTQDALVELALAVARKLFLDYPISAERVEHTVRAVLAQAERASEIHVELNPADLDLLRSTGASFAEGGTGSAALQFHAKPEIRAGGCVVRTDLGVLDAQLEARLALLEEVIKE